MIFSPHSYNYTLFYIICISSLFFLACAIMSVFLSTSASARSLQHGGIEVEFIHSQTNSALILWISPGYFFSRVWWKTKMGAEV